MEWAEGIDGDGSREFHWQQSSEASVAGARRTEGRIVGDGFGEETGRLEGDHRGSFRPLWRLAFSSGPAEQPLEDIL